MHDDRDTMAVREHREIGSNPVPTSTVCVPSALPEALYMVMAHLGEHVHHHRCRPVRVDKSGDLSHNRWTQVRVTPGRRLRQLH